jgi:hypothetical protein
MRGLDMPTSVLSRWRRESDTFGRNSFPGNGNQKQTDGQREIAELKKGSGMPNWNISSQKRHCPSLKRYAISFPDAASSPRATRKTQVHGTPQIQIPGREDVQMLKVIKSGYYQWLVG